MKKSDYYYGLDINHDYKCEPPEYCGQCVGSALSFPRSPYFLDTLMVKINVWKSVYI